MAAFLPFPEDGHPEFIGGDPTPFDLVLFYGPILLPDLHDSRALGFAFNAALDLEQLAGGPNPKPGGEDFAGGWIKTVEEKTNLFFRELMQGKSPLLKIISVQQRSELPVLGFTPGGLAGYFIVLVNGTRPCSNQWLEEGDEWFEGRLPRQGKGSQEG